MINIYDFDYTIYNGDSSVDFFKFCFKRNKKVLLIVPNFIFSSILYIFKRISKEQLKSRFFSFVRYLEDVDADVELFWDKNSCKIKDFYLKQKSNSDIIISASPEFLLQPIARRIGFKLIATKVDKKTGCLLEKNCYGYEKVLRLKKLNIKGCNKFYTDSLSDLPLINFAKNAFVVHNDIVIDWETYSKNKKTK